MLGRVGPLPSDDAPLQLVGARLEIQMLNRISNNIGFPGRREDKNNANIAVGRQVPTNYIESAYFFVGLFRLVDTRDLKRSVWSIAHS